MVIHLYGSVISTCTRRVAVVLHEKQIPFVLHPIDLKKGEHKAPEFVAKQPFGQVPFIDDDGFILYESRAICHYLEIKYTDQGTSLIPKDLKENALYQQAASIEAFDFNDSAEKIAIEMIFKPARGLTSDKATFDRLVVTLSAKLDVYDKILSKQKYLAGDKITLADLYHLPYASLLPVAGANLIDERLNVARWYKDISSRPSWQAVKDGVKSTA